MNNINILIPKIFKIFKENKINGDILIVDDNSPDGTANLAKKLSKKYPIKILEREKKLGIGSAYVLGFKKSLEDKKDIIFEMDSDLSHDPKYIPEFIEKINSGFDVVIGERKKVVGWNWYRKLISWGGNFIGRNIAGVKIKDLTTGYRAYKRHVLDSINLDKINSYIDSSNILFLIGFPTAQTPINLTDKVFSAINKADKPFFFILSPQTDLNRLKRIKSKLPFSFARISSQTVWVQPSIVNSETGLLKNNGRFDKSLWNSLPPIAISKTDFRVKPEANLLSQISINNQVLFYPLIIADNIGNSNSIAILGFDIWRWKLQANKFNESIFDSFILNSVKWLNNFKHNNLFSLRTSKKVFFVGDKIILSAQLYDQTFSPINNANIVATVKTRDGINHFNLSLTGNGLYSGKVNQLPVGSYNLSAEAKIGNKIIGKSKVKIRIENSNLESSVTVMNNNLLRLISKLSGGKYFDISQFEKVNNAINNFNSTNKKEIAVTKTYDFFSFEWILFIIIFLFGLEWFLRKRSGLL